MLPQPAVMRNCILGMRSRSETWSFRSFVQVLAETDDVPIGVANIDFAAAIGSILRSAENLHIPFAILGCQCVDIRNVKIGSPLRVPRHRLTVFGLSEKNGDRDTADDTEAGQLAPHAMFRETEHVAVLIAAI